MSPSSISRRWPAFSLAALFVLLLTVTAFAQTEPSGRESQSWQQKWGSDDTDFVQEQFQANPLLFFAAVFALGVLVSLTPCVLPMIPITVSIISGSKQHVPGRSFARGALAGFLSSLLYVLGLSITYALLGVAVALMGGVFRSHLQNWPVQTAMGVLFMILGLSMVGVISLPIPGWGRGAMEKVTQRQQTRRSLPMVFALGLVSGIIASPCVAPVIGALLSWISTTERIWLGFWSLFAFGWGMGLLLIIMGLTGWILSSGKWMVTVKIVLGLVLILMGVLVVIQGIRGQPLVPASWLGG